MLQAASPWPPHLDEAVSRWTCLTPPHPTPLAWMKRFPMTAATEEMAALASACDEKVTRADLLRCPPAVESDRQTTSFIEAGTDRQLALLRQASCLVEPSSHVLQPPCHTSRSASRSNHHQPPCHSSILANCRLPHLPCPESADGDGEGDGRSSWQGARWGHGACGGIGRAWKSLRTSTAMRRTRPNCPKCLFSCTRTTHRLIQILCLIGQGHACVRGLTYLMEHLWIT